MVSVVFRFWKRHGESAGDVASVGEARPRTNTTICCRINRRKMSKGAPERGGGDREEEEARGPLARSESTGVFCRFAVLRRGISSSSVHVERKDERERREGRVGSL
jgi:hypothetical protein